MNSESNATDRNLKNICWLIIVLCENIMVVIVTNRKEPVLNGAGQDLPICAHRADGSGYMDES